MNTFSKLYLALLGLFPWEYVPTIPCEVILIGKWFYVNFNEMSSWSRSMLVPLAIINHFKPTRELKKKINLNELYPQGIHERDLALAPDPERITWRNFFLWLDRVHKFAEWFAQTGYTHSASGRCARPSNGCWSALKARTAWPRFSRGYSTRSSPSRRSATRTITRRSCGRSASCKKLEHETEQSVRIEPCFSPVWDTAIVNVCLHESGLPADHPALVRATEWLMAREIRFRGDWQYKNPAKVEPSGWVFEFAEQMEPGRGRHGDGAAGAAQGPDRRPAEARRVFPARLEMDDDLPMQRRRLGCFR